MERIRADKSGRGLETKQRKNKIMCLIKCAIRAFLIDRRGWIPRLLLRFNRPLKIKSQRLWEITFLSLRACVAVALWPSLIDTNTPYFQQFFGGYVKLVGVGESYTSYNLQTVWDCIIFLCSLFF